MKRLNLACSKGRRSTVQELAGNTRTFREPLATSPSATSTDLSAGVPRCKKYRRRGNGVHSTSTSASVLDALEVRHRSNVNGTPNTERLRTKPLVDVSESNM